VYLDILPWHQCSETPYALGFRGSQRDLAAEVTSIHKTVHKLQGYLSRGTITPTAKVLEASSHGVSVHVQKPLRTASSGLLK